jgi:hypothetical protein
VQQKLMRHANISTTMNIYGGAFMESKRKANTFVVRRVLSQTQPQANATGIAKGHHSRWPLFLSLCLLDYFGLELKIPIPRNLMIALVAGVGFEPTTFGL